MEVVAPCFHWSQPGVGYTPAQTFSSIFPSVRRSRRTAVLLRRLDHRSALFGRTHGRGYVRIAAGAAGEFSGDGFDDEEFARTLEELAKSFASSGDEAVEVPVMEQGRNRDDDVGSSSSSPVSVKLRALGEPPWEVVSPVPPEWPHPGAIIPASVERKANSVELPLSLRMIKRKKKQQWHEGGGGGLALAAGESAYCSVKKAFSSMVFIIRELQSYTLQLRELLYYEDLQGILGRVQNELNASFVWLFQQIFSQTPTLMVCVMILLANFTVYSVGTNSALAAAPVTPTTALEHRLEQTPSTFHSGKSYSITGGGKSASIGGGGSGKVRPTTGATDGGRYEQLRRAVFPSTTEEERVADTSPEVMETEEGRVWNAMVEETMEMQPHIRDGVMDQETMQRFVSPVTVQIAPDDYDDYRRTELSYQLAVAQEPDNPLLLANYAQFLFLVVHDHDRAEGYFKRAVQAQPPDAESLSRYASFLWLARKNVDAAEETYLEAIAADPGNTFHASNYAHFLWNTGGEGTCYPLP